MATVKEKLEAAINDLEAVTVERNAAWAEIKDMKDKAKVAADQAASIAKYNGDQLREAQSEIEQLHCVLDGLTGAPPRKTAGEHSWEQKNLTLAARMCGFFASRYSRSGEQF